MKVGDYVRTIRGQIGNLKKIVDKKCEIEFNGMWKDLISKESIIKSSPNIIDLIQEGDFINGKQISEVEVSKFDGIKRAYDCEYETGCFTNEMIKSVVTKEQFESCIYKIGD